jgi:hypothetical protein
MEGSKIQPALVTLMTGKGQHPRNFTKTLYDKNGKLKDEGYIDRAIERSYWEAFIDPRQARELERRLTLVESPEYTPGSTEFSVFPVTSNASEDDDVQDTD